MADVDVNVIVRILSERLAGVMAENAVLLAENMALRAQLPTEGDTAD